MRVLHAYSALFFAVVGAFRSPRVQALMLVCVLIALAQASVFALLEGWRFLDAFYFSVVSMATVGYGDLAPVTAAGKLAAMAFLLVGVGVFVLTVSSVAQAILGDLTRAERRQASHPEPQQPRKTHDHEPVRHGERRKGG